MPAATVPPATSREESWKAPVPRRPNGDMTGAAPALADFFA
jgi:hypothetical protein